MNYVLIFGLHPDISLAEAESVFKVLEKSRTCARISSDLVPIETIDTLGGTIKIVEPLIELTSTDKNAVLSAVDSLILNKFSDQNKGVFGISDYAQLFKDETEYSRMLGKIKKSLGKAWRYASGYPALNTVSVAKNKLVEQGFETVFYRLGDKTYLGRTLAVQDFDDYAARDYGKPCRADEVGMMPPKLAKMLINLTTRAISRDYVSGPLVLDPFCGSGTIAAEALLLNYKVVGSDLSEAMVACARKNMRYIVERYRVTQSKKPEELIFKADAKKLPLRSESVDFVVTEGYLAPMWKKKPTTSEVTKFLSEQEDLLSEFLEEAGRVLKPGGRLGMTLAEIDGQTPEIVDTSRKLGYSVLVKNLVYKRKEQIVGRNIIILEKR